MYTHVQRSPIHFLLYMPTTIVFIVAWQAYDEFAPGTAVVIGIVALSLLVLALSFQTLTISDGGEYLEIQYGPLNLFGTKIAYRDMTAVERGQTSVIDGWGIHFIPFRGWTFNLWGFECVKIWQGKKLIRVGTDDSESLARFLLERNMNQTDPD